MAAVAHKFRVSKIQQWMPRTLAPYTVDIPELGCISMDLYWLQATALWLFYLHVHTCTSLLVHFLSLDRFAWRETSVFM